MKRNVAKHDNQNTRESIYNQTVEEVEKKWYTLQMLGMAELADARKTKTNR